MKAEPAATTAAAPAMAQMAQMAAQEQMIADQQAPTPPELPKPEMLAENNEGARQEKMHEEAELISYAKASLRDKKVVEPSSLDLDALAAVRVDGNERQLKEREAAASMAKRASQPQAAADSATHDYDMNGNALFNNGRMLMGAPTPTAPAAAKPAPPHTGGRMGSGGAPTQTAPARIIASNREVDDSHIYRFGGGVTFPNSSVGFAPPYEPGPDHGITSPSLDDFPERRDNPFRRVADQPLSTFSIDVDTASYAVVRKFLREGRLPPTDAVRIEELINYFSYDYQPPTDGRPFAAAMELARCPWNPANQLVRIGIKGREIARAQRPPANLVFLIDVSGSMNAPNKLPLVVRSLQTLARELDGRDQVAIVVYAGAAGLVLPSTNGLEREQILNALGRLQAGGSTAGSQGIQLAYEIARRQFRAEAVNRVILCTDGDFNVGITRREQLEQLIAEQAKSGVFLTVLGFGMGNYKDSTLELLSNKGNGNYAYIDDFSEARKVLVEQMSGTLVTIAKDVKIQVEFNPAQVSAYRLLGYENRMLRKEDFNNDRIDAGDIGAGHTVTAFYELVPAGARYPEAEPPPVDPLKYQAESNPELAASARRRAAPPAPVYPPTAATAEVLTLKLRYKQPEGEVSSKLEFPLAATSLVENPSADFRFAAAVAGFGMLLRQAPERGNLNFAQVLDLAGGALGEDNSGYRSEFVKLARDARSLVQQ
ncbi:MAG: von Willebrand factor [Deltaproteobacteria bacterium ADurb.Bin207]|nr:MAG: von Willebrand factor [Deltaproteobacteria bacterium ADurb.Bin207]